MAVAHAMSIETEQFLPVKPRPSSTRVSGVRSWRVRAGSQGQQCQGN
ncbi:hypothetical protein HMPREF9578_00596 [Cutibacterium acnes HL110PA4]|nr:hypothetical protein HMPREF9603_00569 [Cutibacterium acnes HL001PA1]EFT27150.1 hypothetical protein HMPREF9577_00251 [Cutibacterium acnes HL110PA3]EFT63576.1 hypothetical protein HMPREF9578_00596 [Cutibacterium acnes HL110PA4]KFC15548.1 hypothetical protein PAST2_00480 [Cutibacterium acnes HL202PA1]